MADLVVIAPGRGSYHRTELGYFQRFSNHPRFEARVEVLEKADALRRERGEATLREMDGAKAFRSSLHLPGENASALIYGCSAADFQMIAPRHRIRAVLGNSMGWYTTLFAGGALSFEDAFRLVNAMGSFQKGNVQGGQIIVPVVDERWRPSAEKEAALVEALRFQAEQGEERWAGLSIKLGGFWVLAGTNRGIAELMGRLPKVRMGANEYPFQLAGHAAFHTHLMRDASSHGLSMSTDLAWNQPRTPMIDGRGHIWRRHQSAPRDLRSYTLVDQVMRPFDFSLALKVALREYNPDHLVLLGPGETLGGAIAHVMIAEGWRGIDSKRAFQEAQRSEKPPLIAFNRPEQAGLVL